MKTGWLVPLAALAIGLLPTVGHADAEKLLGSKDAFFKPRLGEKIDRELTFLDSTGKEVKLGDYGQTRPLILVPAYYRCPMLCTLVLNDLVRCLRAMPFNAGDEFEVVVVSFDARETPELAAAKKKAYVEEYGRPNAEKGWHFLTGKQPEIDALLDQIGFKAVWDEKQQQFAHARGILILTPQWMVTRYFLEGTYPPRDMRMALVEGSEGKVGSPMDRVLLMCFNYNPVEGKYSMSILSLVRLGGLVTIGIVVLFWGLAWIRPAQPRLPVRAPTAALAVGGSTNGLIVNDTTIQTK